MVLHFGINHFPLKSRCPFAQNRENAVVSFQNFGVFGNRSRKEIWQEHKFFLFSLFFLLCFSQCFSWRSCLKWTAGALITATTADKQGNSLFDHGNNTVASALRCVFNESFILLNHHQNQPLRVDQHLFALESCNVSKNLREYSTSWKAAHPVLCLLLCLSVSLILHSG